MILFQWPPSFKPTGENVRNMRQFFAAIERPRGVRLLWKPRDAWPDQSIVELCRDLELVHVVDPFARPVLSTGLVYWRLHGIKTHYASYTDEQLARLAGWIDADRETYVMFNNIPRAADTVRFRALLDERG